MNIPEKGRKLFEEGKVVKEVNTDRRIHYRVVGDTEEYSIIFDKVKKEYSCDCRYSSLQKKECSHIMACRLSESR